LEKRLPKSRLSTFSSGVPVKELCWRHGLDISLIETVDLDRGRFRISDGRHRAVVLALRKEILSQKSAGPATEPELYEKEPVPFLTFRDAAEVMKSNGWLVSPSMDFDLQACSSKVYF
jgi:hypothetical protein